MRYPHILLNTLLASCLLIALGGTAMAQQITGTVTIFHAGSLSLPMAAMEKAFEAKYPAVDIQREASGSQKAARKISDLHRPCDIMASADYKVIDKLLRPKHSDNNIRFASNRMVLCYTPQSRFADTITSNNWLEILQKPEVNWGHSAPDLDPCGYRALMVLQLAEKHYALPDLYNKLLANRPLVNVRPKAVQLIAMLQSGEMDYAWEYRSVAIQNGLNFIELPQEINLGNYRFDPLYAEAKVEVSGKAAGSTMTMQGKSITYGVTLLKNAPNPQAATAFLDYMLAPTGGQKILSDMGQPPFIPSRVSSAAMRDNLPSQVQQRITIKN